MEYLIHKQLTAALILLHITGTLYGAAQEARVALPFPPDLQKEPAGLIGMCASKRGNYALVSSYEKLDTKKEAHYTIVYSEHPELKAGENLARIAATIAAKSYETDAISWNFFALEVKTLCKQETADYLQPATTTDEPLSPANNISYALLTASLKLTPEQVFYAGCDYRPTGWACDGSGSYRFDKAVTVTDTGERHRTMYKKLVLGYFTPILHKETTTDPQIEAERLQGELPENPFHFVVDLDKWLELVAPEEPEEPAKSPFDFAAELEQIGRCTII